jgi:hypothetical protein
MVGMIMGLGLIGRLVDPTLDVHAPPAAFQLLDLVPRGEVALVSNKRSASAACLTASGCSSISRKPSGRDQILISQTLWHH